MCVKLFLCNMSDFSLSYILISVTITSENNTSNCFGQMEDSKHKITQV